MADAKKAPPKKAPDPQSPAAGPAVNTTTKNVPEFYPNKEYQAVMYAGAQGRVRYIQNGQCFAGNFEWICAEKDKDKVKD
jgi:hypothetical protein